jgi:uncharacterized membrane protein
MNRAASISAVVAFFGMALIGAVSGATPFTCALRALAGAAIMYVFMRVAGRVVVAILVEALVGRPPASPEEKDPPHERSNP